MIISKKKSYQGKELKKMTDKVKSKTGTAEYADAKVAADTMSKDAGVKAQDGTGDVKKGDRKPGSREAKAAPHIMDRNVTLSIRHEKLTCPRCGESTLHAEFPDQFEAWIKCSSCDFFMGMSNDEWHRMKNSPNINEKIKKMALKKELLKD